MIIEAVCVLDFFQVAYDVNGGIPQILFFLARRRRIAA